MPYPIDETHDPALESWVESANDPGTDFPIQNLPLCVIWEDDHDQVPAVRIGDKLFNLHRAASAGLLENSAWESYLVGSIGSVSIISPWSEPSRWDWGRLRQRLSDVFRSSEHRQSASRFLHESSTTRHDLTALAHDYTDFYASLNHATNVGSMFRPGNALLPNYKHVPIAYHGRASTIVPSGTPVVRPWGQQASAEEGGDPSFGPCKMLDYELEVGVVVGRGNEMGSAIPIGEAEDHILGLCLVNDWSARDLQKWEYQPLGPFLAKNFATSVSPYIVTMEALAPFRCPALERGAGDPRPLPYLSSDHDRAHGGIDITLEVLLASKQMRDRGMAPVRVSKGSFKDMYWTVAQMLTHHASNGCRMQPGDLLASGTVSGKARESRGCLLERTWDGDAFAEPPVLVPGTQRTPIELPTGEKRVFLADGDEVILKGYCEREGFRRIGFGECRGVIEAARQH